MSIEFKENPLLVIIEEVFRISAPGWKLKNAIYSDETKVYSEWHSQSDEVVAQIVMMPSPEAAKTNLRLFDRNFRVTHDDESSTFLPALGDESQILTQSDNLRGTVIKFRTGMTIVQVSGSDFEVLVSLASALADRLKSTQD